MGFHPLPQVTPIANISSLANLLEITVEDLEYVLANKDRYWCPGKKLTKPNGEVRHTHNAKPRLKAIHQKILDKLLKKVFYPIYMQGGVADLLNPRSCRTHAAFHCNKSIVISEDIKSFFPNCDYKNIRSIWQGFFCMAPEIAEILTQLTTYQNELPQGWKTSGYLAQLIFYDIEPKLVEDLDRQQVAYSRYIDDITISSSRPLTDQQKTDIISKIYSMVFHKAHHPNRKKQTIFSPSVNGVGKTVTGLTVNSKKPTINNDKRKKLRSDIHKLSLRFHTDKNLYSYDKDWRSITSKVGHIKTSHPRQWKKFRQEMNAIKPTFKRKKKTNTKKAVFKGTIDGK